MCIQYEDLSAPKKPIPIVQQLFLPYLSVCKIQNNMLIQIKSSSRPSLASVVNPVPID